MSNCS